MPKQKQKRTQTAPPHQKSISTPTDNTLIALDDALLAQIISYLRKGPRRQLRLVCHRFKDLIDQQVTKVKMDLTIFPGKENCRLVERAALLWPETRSVQLEAGSGNIVGADVVRALANCHWPKLEKIEFGGCCSGADSAAALASSRGMPALRELWFSTEWEKDGELSSPGGLETAGIEALAKGLYWANLEVLMIGYETLGPTGGASLAKMSHAMPALRSLSLCMSEMSDANLKDFCKGEWRSLEVLQLKENDMGAESGAIFAKASKKLVKLRELHIEGSKLGNTGLKRLLSGHWPCLEKLGLVGVGLDYKAGAILAAASQRLPSLRDLDMPMNELEDRGFCALLKGHWPLLERLDTSENDSGVGALTASTAAALVAASLRCPNIRELSFSGEDFVDVYEMRTLAQGTWDSVIKLALTNSVDYELVAVTALAESLSLCLPNLKELSLHNCYIGTRGLKVVSRGQWKCLEILDLTENSLDSASALLLAEASLNFLSELKCLCLYANEGIKNAGIKSLMKGNWSKLETLDISNTSVEGIGGARAVAAAASRLPNLRELNIESNPIHKAGGLLLAKADWCVLEKMLIDKPSTDKGVVDRKAVVDEMKAAAHLNGFALQVHEPYFY